MDQAVRAAAEIAAGWAPVLSGVELRSGSKGVFKISIDGKVVFDKAETGRFPAKDDLLSIVQKSLGPRLTWRGSEHP